MAIAYPFVEVEIDTSGLQPVAQRSPGVLAIVGSTAGKGTAAVNEAKIIDSLGDAVALYNQVNADGVPVVEQPLYKALRAAFAQDPAPSRIYAVKLDGTKWDAGLAALEAADDVTIVAVAGQNVGTAAASNVAATELQKHCETQSSAGNKRIGVAHVDTAIAFAPDYAATITTATMPFKSGSSRMVMIAARGAIDDDDDPAEVGAAAASAIAGQAPATSMVLKKIRGFRLPLSGQYSPGEIKALSEEEIIPIIDPALITGESLHFAEGTCFTTDASMLYIDTVRLLDDVEFKLKASLIGMIGDARISRIGLASVIRRAEGVLDQVKSSGSITGYQVIIPVYNALLKPEAARTAGEAALIVDTRASRRVDTTVIIVIGPAIHRLSVALQPRF